MSAALLRGATFVTFLSLALAACEPRVEPQLRLYVASASAETDPRSGGPRILVNLKDNSRQDFLRFTTKYIGQPVDVLIDGKSIYKPSDKPIIREPIIGGPLAMRIEGLDEARVLAERLTDGKATLDVEAGKN